MEIPYGYCHCGCGKKTKIATKTDSSTNRTKGIPMKFCHGHNNKGELNPTWKGGIKISGRTKDTVYRQILMPNHPNATKQGYVLEHILIASKAMGMPLPSNAVIHHVNGNRLDNNNRNLVICENHGYHVLLHYRSKALREGGNAHFCKCRYCGNWDDPKNLIKINTNRNIYYHKQCANEYFKKRSRRDANI